MGNVTAAVRALTLGFWLGLMSGGNNTTPTSLFIPEEDVWVAAHPIIRTCVDAYWRPFGFVKAGKVTSMIPSFLDAVVHVSGSRFECVDGACRNGPLAALKLGQAGMLPDWSKDKAVALYRDGYIASMPHYTRTITTVMAERENLFASSSQLSGKQLVIKGGGGLELAIRRSSVPVKLVTFRNESGMSQAVAGDDTDAAPGADVSIVPQPHWQFKGRLSLSGNLWDRPYALTMVTCDDNPVLASILDKSLTAISASEVDAIRQRWRETTDYGALSLVLILHYR